MSECSDANSFPKAERRSVVIIRAMRINAGI